MSEPDSPTRGELHHQQQLHQSSSQHNAADERDDANNSIIGKVKSRVSSIFPQKLTKWFSPSTTTTTTSNGGVGRRRRRNIQCEQEEYERANNSDDESNNSADDEEGASPAFTQPPTKRSRLNVEVNTVNTKNFKDSQSLVSSTPTTGPRRRLTHINLYGKQKEPAYSFAQTKYTTNTSRSFVTTKSSPVDSADIIEVVPDRNLLNTSISSRRSLNMPSTSSTDGYRNLYDLKRQSVSKLGTSGSGPSTYTAKRTSTTILEIQDDDDDDDNEQEGVHKSGNQTMVVEEVDDDIEEEDEESEEIAKVTSKKQKFTNGNLVGRSSSVATESGESRSSSVAQTVPPKSGLFNPANRGLRTLSGNGLNFYSHLEGRKSLFSEKNMPGMLNNSTLSLTSLNRRQFNSSIYGSTSALSDSRLINTSSPFYKGQTTYGGAAAYGKFNRALNQSVRIAPTLIRPTSSLSMLSSSTNSLAHGNDQSAISNTAKRILELINDFSTPLNDAKKMASNIKTPAMIANRSASGGKRFSEADLATSRGVRLSTVRSPYTRPSVTLKPSSNESKRVVPTLKELQVPSMSQLLQMKRMQNCTERSRHIANTSKSALNQECEYKLPRADESTSGDKNGSKHMSKIKQKFSTSSRVSSKNIIVEDEEAPAPANLPNIAFPFMQSVPKIDISVKSPVAQSKPTAKTDFKFAVSADAKPTNNFSFGVQHKAAQGEKSPTPATSKPSMNFNFGTSSAVSSPIAASSNEFKFSSPLSVRCTASKEDLTPIDNFKFSSPVMVGAGNGEVQKLRPTSSAVRSTVPQLKTGSVLDALKKPTEKVSPITTKSPTAGVTPTGPSLFGGQFKKPSNEWECSVCMIRNKEAVESCVACTTPRTKPATSVAPITSTLTPLSNSLVKDTFGDAFKPKSDTWECDACMVRNKCDANECVACNTKKPGGSGTVSTTAPKLQSTDVGFKSLVAKQTASKWECDACMTRNDAERNKCVCCEQAKPGTHVVSDNVPQFSFGTSSASKFTFGFAGAKKEDELKAEAAAKTEAQTTGFTFGVPATTDVASANLATVSSTGIAFGVKPVAKPTSSAGEDVPDVVKSNASGFKFGFLPADSSKPVATAAAPAGFSFGNKPDAKPSSVKFNLPPSTAESKPATTSASPITSTSSGSTAAAPAPFNPIASSAFGAPQKVEETKPAAAEPNKSTAGFIFGSSASVPQPTNQHTAAVKPLMFGSSSTSEANKTPPKVTFGAPTTTASPSSDFAFGKPAATASPFSKSLSASSGFAFGKDQSTRGSPAPSMFGSPAATSTAVSSSTTGFVFGKPATTTPMFGASSVTTSATTSVFGSKSSTQFTAASSATAPTSTNTLTLASSSALASTSVTSSAPFIFGSGAAPNPMQSSEPFFGSSPFESGPTAAAASSITGPTPALSSWPTNTFTFGSSKPPEEVKSNAAQAPAFGSPSLFGHNTSIFGSAQVGEVKPNPAAPTAARPGGIRATSLFGSNATSSPAGSVQQTTGNLFGSASSTPIFGSMSFGAAPAAAVAPANTNNVPAAAPTFGSSSSFSSGFGSIAAASSSSGNGDGASAPKKADIAFNFGSAQSSGNSGFSFGSNNNSKPAADSVFKFSTSATPRFNFTGSTEPSNAAQPFQFGAPTSTPAVFNFGGVESNANTRITSVQSAGSSENAYIDSPDNTAVDHSIGSRQWLRPIRDDKNNNTNTYINANAISSSSSQKTSSQQASTIAATYKQQINKELSTFSSQQPQQQQQQQQTKPTQPAIQLQQKPYHYKKTFLMQKYKFYRSSETEQSINSSGSNRSSNVSDGNGGDDDHHDPKDDTKNNDKPSAPNDRDRHDEVEYLTTDNVKTGDESTQTSSSIHSSNKYININPELQPHQHYNNQLNNESPRQLTVRHARSLQYKKFAPSGSKYKMIREAATSAATTTFSDKTTPGATFVAAKILRVPPKRLNNASALAAKRTGNRASYLAKTTTSTTTTATISYPDSAKYKYIKKSQGN